MLKFPTVKVWTISQGISTSRLKTKSIPTVFLRTWWSTDSNKSSSMSSKCSRLKCISSKDCWQYSTHRSASTSRDSPSLPSVTSSPGSSPFLPPPTSIPCLATLSTYSGKGSSFGAGLSSSGSSSGSSPSTRYQSVYSGRSSGVNIRQGFAFLRIAWTIITIFVWLLEVPWKVCWKTGKPDRRDGSLPCVRGAAAQVHQRVQTRPVISQ